MKFKYLIAICFVLFLAPFSLQAEQSENVTGNTGSGEMEYISFDDKVQFNGREYRQASFQNMTKLFWRYELPDIENDKDIDTFLQVNECELYEKFNKNEFEWEPIKQTIRDFLLNNKKNFSDQLYFDVPIEVGDYNTSKGNFTVESRSFSSGRRDFLPNPSFLGWSDHFCGYRRSERVMNKSYPHIVLFKTIRPIIIPTVNVDERKAQELVSQWSQLPDSSPRLLVVRIYLDINRYMGFKKFVGESLEVPIFISSIDGYEVFRSANQNAVLERKVYRKRKGEITVDPKPDQTSSDAP